jgi:hypothetical protein
MIKSPRVLLLMLSPLLTASGCVPKAPTPDELRLGPLNYLQEGTTTREQALLKLGVPSADFEKGRILTYRLAVAPGGAITPRPRQPGLGVPQSADWSDYSLVLVFDDKGVLKKQSLVPVK